MSALDPLDVVNGTIECVVRGDGVDRVETRRCRASFYIDQKHAFWPTFDHDTEIVLFDRRGNDLRPIIYRTTAMSRSVEST